MNPAVIVDVDGTLADVSGIRHYVLDDPHKKLFAKFHAASALVPPIAEVAAVVRALHAAGLTIVVLTSRREQWRHITRRWLAKWEIPFHALGMRADHDNRRDDDVKRDLLIRMRHLYDVDPVLAIDDNPTVIALWRSLGIPTVRVPGWDEQPTTAMPLCPNYRR
jgi:beta-phosphoglucomutase-like phosphatase (HAD superfamily)